MKRKRRCTWPGNALVVGAAPDWRRESTRGPPADLASPGGGGGGCRNRRCGSLRARCLLTPIPGVHDMLMSVSEPRSNALCAMAIRDLGDEAVSLTGSPTRIVADFPAPPSEKHRGAGPTRCTPELPKAATC